MRHPIKLIVLALMLLTVSTGAMAQSAKQKKRCNYVMSSMKMDKAQRPQFQKLFYAYLKELKTAKDIYDAPKDAVKSDIDKHKISDKQAQELTAKRWQSDEQKLKVRRKYAPLFQKMLGARGTFYVFKYANDNIDE